jgi:hypothetical protein
MASSGGRDTVSYLVRCALPHGHSVTKLDEQGVAHTVAGQIGVAPEWETGGCGSTCQEQVTACLLAHVNTSGQHIALWLDGDSAALGWGQNQDYPFQEGSFYGNIFVSPPQGYFCDGKDFAFGVVPGRLGAGQTNAPYMNPLGQDMLCKYRCAAANAAVDGFASCPGIGTDQFRHVVTVWRNFDPSTAYKVCNRASTKCLAVVGGSTASNAAVAQYACSSTLAGARWKVLQVSPQNFKLINVESGLALSTAGGALADGTSLVQLPYAAAATQIWTAKSMADGTGFFSLTPSSSSTAALTVPPSGIPAEGTAINVSDYEWADYQKWAVTLAD